MSNALTRAKALLDNAAKERLCEEDLCKSAVHLAECLVELSKKNTRFSEKKMMQQLAQMVETPNGKTFIATTTDQSFRSHDYARVANQLNYLIEHYGPPKFLKGKNRLGLFLFKQFGNALPKLLVPQAIKALKQETSKVIITDVGNSVEKHIKKRTRQGVRINLNHLGEAILGETEAKARLDTYINDLRQPHIEYISVKISSLFSQINLVAFEQSLEELSERFRELLRVANAHFYTLPTGQQKPKFVNLDMEEYRDLELTVALFKKVLSEQEFFNTYSGIVLQCYLPDSYNLMQELSQFAKQRVEKGGAPIKVRLVKGANLAMERIEASVKDWPQAPYKSKGETDANFKRLLLYGTDPERLKFVHLGVGSHNLFDIAYAMLLAISTPYLDNVTFEMLEGMANPMRRAIQTLWEDILLYCPCAAEKDFHNAIAYLIRRLDENTAPENFLRHSFSLTVGSPEWEEQVAQFEKACELATEVSSQRRRYQNRQSESLAIEEGSFKNESDTDFSLSNNRKWASSIYEKLPHLNRGALPLVIGGKDVVCEDPSTLRDGKDPSQPHRHLFQFPLANKQQVEETLACAKQSQESWNHLGFEERSKILRQVALQFREKRADLIAVMIANTGKILTEADSEVSEAIDFLHYYCDQGALLEKDQEIRWEPRGCCLVTPPWNFPCAIPVGGIAASLIMGNSVIFKPARESVLVGYELAKLFWQAGVPKGALQFITCANESEGNLLIRDPRVDTVILTGSTRTAQAFLQQRPSLHLLAETGGKNSIIVTEMADRDLAISHIIQSAFSHSGQKCSAASLCILLREVYDDPSFWKQLKDAASSLKVGSAWDPSTKVGPLIRYPNSELLWALTQTDAGEEWVLKPNIDNKNPLLWSPGIKKGVRQGTRSHLTEFFGPVLGVMAADSLDEAIELANMTPYGLTAGLHSLDEREHEIWKEQIEAGNLYINRPITGAIVQRQAFGGHKASSFGPGFKAGGPHYLKGVCRAIAKQAPKKGEDIRHKVQNLLPYIPSELKELLGVAMRNYAYYWNKIKAPTDYSLIIGQDNLYYLRPFPKITLRLEPPLPLQDLFLVVAATRSVNAPLELSLDPDDESLKLPELPYTGIQILYESEKEFLHRLKKHEIERLRALHEVPDSWKIAAAAGFCYIAQGPASIHASIELHHYLHEISLSTDYHRYGNLLAREDEPRAPII